MKRSLLKMTSAFLLIILSIPTIFATSIDTSSKAVTVGTVENTNDVIYDVQIEWGSMVFDFVKTDGELEHEEYFWKRRDGGGSAVDVINMSSVPVKAEIAFTPNIRDVIGTFNGGSTYTELYSLVNEKPSEWETLDVRHCEFIDGEMIPVVDGTEFVPGKYYIKNGAGGNGLSDGYIPGMTDIDGEIEISSISWLLSLEGGSLSEVRPGATIGTVTVTIS